jgi:spore coat polysaccharide biosynthesis protein SpsF (cytidylyltransferase family)
MNISQGIIIQARTQSTRLPDKVILPFYNGECILEIILKRFIEAFPGIPLIVATGSGTADDRIESIVNKYPPVRIFRGNDSNVLKRFIDAAEFYNITSIMRVCSDNLFIDMKLAEHLLSLGIIIQADYLSYKLEGDLPVIRSHQGFYTELVSLDALKRTAIYTNERTYLEHVTNYLYSHPKQFKIYLELVPDLLLSAKDIRLTIDAPEDFENSLTVYRRLRHEDLEISYENVMRIVRLDDAVLNSMNIQIKLNSK